MGSHWRASTSHTLPSERDRPPGKREIRAGVFAEGDAQSLYFKPKPIVIEVTVAVELAELFEHRG